MSDPVQIRSASTFCGDRSAFVCWTESFPYLNVEHEAQSDTFDAKEELFAEWPKDLTASLQCTTDPPNLFAGLYMLQRHKYDTKASFRSVFDCMYKYVFKGKGYSPCMEARTFLPAMAQGGMTYSFPDSTTDIDIAAIRKIEFFDQVIAYECMPKATLTLNVLPSSKRFYITVCPMEYNLTSTDQVVNRLVMDLIAIAQFLLQLGLRDLEVHGIVLTSDAPIKLYVAKIDEAGHISIVSSDAVKDIDPQSPEGFMKLYVLLCRIRDYAEANIVKKCQALTTEAFEDSQWQWVAIEPATKRRVYRGTKSLVGGDTVRDEDGEVEGDGLKSSHGSGGKSKRRLSDSPSPTQNKGGARNGKRTRSATLGHEDKLTIASPSPRYPSDKSQSILAPDFF